MKNTRDMKDELRSFGSGTSDEILTNNQKTSTGQNDSWFYACMALCLVILAAFLFFAVERWRYAVRVEAQAEYIQSQAEYIQFLEEKYNVLATKYHDVVNGRNPSSDPALANNANIGGGPSAGPEIGGYDEDPSAGVEVERYIEDLDDLGSDAAQPTLLSL